MCTARASGVCRVVAHSANFPKPPGGEEVTLDVCTTQERLLELIVERLNEHGLAGGSLDIHKPFGEVIDEVLVSSEAADVTGQCFRKRCAKRIVGKIRGLPGSLSGLSDARALPRTNAPVKRIARHVVEWFNGVSLRYVAIGRGGKNL